MKDKQWKRILRALLNGEVITNLWAAHQVLMIVRPGNRCNEMISKGIPIQKIMIYPENGAHYMTYFLKKDYIQRAKMKLP